MLMLPVFLLAEALAFAVGPAGTSSEEISGAPLPTQDSNRIVCKYELKTGTRFKARTCMTVKEWEAMREQHRRAASEMADKPKLDSRCSPQDC